jgi:hypothetical protein
MRWQSARRLCWRPKSHLPQEPHVPARRGCAPRDQGV